MKRILKDALIMFILTLIILLMYATIHELTHWTSCEVVGLNGKIKIDLSVDPPLYSATCDRINEKSNISKFLFWGSPYLVSLILMTLFLIYLNKEKFYLIGLPLGIALSDVMNIFGLYVWIHKAGNPGNDLLNILFKTPKGYFVIIAVIIGLTLSLFLCNLVLFYREIFRRFSFSSKQKLNSEILKNNRQARETLRKP